jgi:hypothetical protein
VSALLAKHGLGFLLQPRQLHGNVGSDRRERDSPVAHQAHATKVGQKTVDHGPESVVVEDPFTLADTIREDVKRVLPGNEGL